MLAFPHRVPIKEMKATWILPFLGGLVLGGSGVYFGMRDISWSSAAAQADSEHTTPVHDNPATNATNPFESGKNDSSGYGLILTDPNSVKQRHMCIALWYADYSVESFGRHVGHEFRPVWNRRSPVEILEEHLEFMKKFMADTERLQKQTGIDSQEDK